MDKWDALINKRTCQGWVVERNDEDKLHFTFYEDEDHEWCEDWNKKTGRFAYYNGKTKINIHKEESSGVPKDQ